MPNTTTPEAEITNWNAIHPVGTEVRYWTGVREGDGRVSVTRTPAQLLGGHTPVVWVTCEASCIALTHVQPFHDSKCESEFIVEAGMYTPCRCDRRWTERSE